MKILRTSSRYFKVKLVSDEHCRIRTPLFVSPSKRCTTLKDSLSQQYQCHSDMRCSYPKYLKNKCSFFFQINMFLSQKYVYVYVYICIYLYIHIAWSFKDQCFSRQLCLFEEDELQSLSDHSPVPHHETSKMMGAGVDFFVPEVP